MQPSKEENLWACPFQCTVSDKQGHMSNISKGMLQTLYPLVYEN